MTREVLDHPVLKDLLDHKEILALKVRRVLEVLLVLL